MTSPVVADERYAVEVHYSGTPEPVEAPTTRDDFNTTGFTITPEGEAWTMQEPYGAHTWYPVNDQPSDKALYDFTLSVPSPVGRGRQRRADPAQGRGAARTTTRWHLAEPAASYLTTVAFGDYTTTSNTSASGVEIDYWVPSDEPQLAGALGAGRRRARLAGGAARALPVRHPRLRPRRLAERHGDPDHDHARQDRLHAVGGRAPPRDGAPVVRRPGHAQRLA